MRSQEDHLSLQHVRRSKKYILVPELALLYNVHTDLFDVLLNGEVMQTKLAVGLTAEDNPKRIEADDLTLKVIALMRSLENKE